MPQRARLLLVALFVPLALQAQSALPPKRPPQPTVAAITAGDLATRLYIFSDDSMQGREAGTAGNVKGTAYIAAELKRLGLVPGGDDGTYFQTIPLKTRTLDTTSTLAVAGTPLKAFTDYLALGPEPLERSTLASVYGGERRALQGLGAERQIVCERLQRRARDREGRRGVQGARLERDGLEVRPVVAPGDEAQALELGRDVRRALHVPGRPRLPPLHRIVRKDVEPGR